MTACHSALCIPDLSRVKEQWRRWHRKPGIYAALVLVMLVGPSNSARTWEWFPTDQEMQKFRQSWNPQTHGPLLVSPADLQAKGRWLLWAFGYGQVTNGRFGSSLSPTGSGTPFHQDVIAPGAVLFYGLTDHISLGVRR
jgi:hypothetical protein